VGYYSPAGPVGQVFDMLRREGATRDVAVLGLGAGSLACYAESGQRWTFYEINPTIAALARTPAYFTYLSDSPVASDVVIGDARLALAAREDARYDLIVVDVFSSDAIPVHLLTSEAFRGYIDRLAPKGRILFHTSNLYFNLRTPVGAAALSTGLSAVARRHDVDANEAEQGTFPSEWILVARNPADLAPLLDAPDWQRLAPGPPAWTDDFSSLLSALTWKR
jgi:spermidine synthase